MNVSLEKSLSPTRKIAAVIGLCGLGVTFAATAATAAGADTGVTAASVEGAMPAISIKYDPESLSDDGAVRALYRRIVAASQKVCPDVSVHRFPSAAVESCRRQSIERAVLHVNNPRLASLDANRSKNG